MSYPLPCGLAFGRCPWLILGPTTVWDPAVTDGAAKRTASPAAIHRASRRSDEVETPRPVRGDGVAHR